MTLDELITRRLVINEEQLESLETILVLNKRKSEKIQIRRLLKEKFYSSFEGTEFSKEIEILPFGVSWNAGSHKKNKLKAIQKHLLEK